MKTVLITGGAGFIGSFLCERFLDEGYEVLCYDNLITGNEDNIKHLERDKNFFFYKQDVSKEIKLKGKLDLLLHFASPASPVDYLEYPFETMRAGSLAVENTLKLAKEKKARYLFASTSEVYGDPELHPQKEEYWGNVNPIGPRAVYDEAKRFGEAMTMAYHRYYGLDTRIARIFNTYGPRMRLKDGRVVPNFISQALNEEPLTVYGDGTQTRSFCYISDLVEGIFRLSQSKYTQPVNLGNPEERTIMEFARLIIKLVKSKSEIVFAPLPEDDPKQRCPDITRALSVLGWKPKVPLEDGLRETIEFFRKKLKGKKLDKE